MRTFERHVAARLVPVLIAAIALGLGACSGKDKAAQQGASELAASARSPEPVGNDDESGRQADPERIGTFAVCAGLPRDYFGDAGDITPDQLKAEPEAEFPAPRAVATHPPPHATPMAAAFGTMWSKGIEAAAVADAIQATMHGLRMAIVWNDMDRAGKLVEHMSKLMQRMAAAGKASRLAEAKLLRIEVAPLLQNDALPILDIDDPVGMQRAFIAWQQKLGQDGLPPETVAKLERVGWTDKDIAAMTSGAVRAPAGQVVSQTLYGTVLAVANIRHYEQGGDQQAAAANAELEMLRKGVTDCGPTL